MKRYLPLLIAGMLILPIIFDAIRQGALLLTVVLTFGLSAFSTFMANRFGIISAFSAIVSFALGAFISEVYFFTSWYVVNNPEGQTISDGAVVATIEWCAIAVIGSISIALTNYFLNCLRKK